MADEMTSQPAPAAAEPGDSASRPQPAGAPAPTAAGRYPLTPKSPPFRAASGVTPAATGPAAAPLAGAPPPSLGQTLREARERRQLSLSQVSQKIHVPVDFIGKAEAGQLDAFPPPVYSKSYLRQLAREYGLDAEPLLQEYLDFLKGSPDRAALPAADQLRLQAAAAEPAPAAPPPPDRKPFSMTKPSPSMIAVGIVLAGLLALAAAAFILNRGKTAPAATGPVPEPPPAATATATTGLDLERFITPEELPVKELPIPNR